METELSPIKTTNTMGHDEHHAPAASSVPGEPTPYVSDPTRASTVRCKRRWNDLALLRVDAMAPKTYTGPGARFPNQMDLMKLVRERYLLFAQCVESKPGQEPKHPYLYPQPAVAAAHH